MKSLLALALVIVLLHIKQKKKRSTAKFVPLYGLHNFGVDQAQSSYSAVKPDRYQLLYLIEENYKRNLVTQVARRRIRTQPQRRKLENWLKVKKRKEKQSEN